MATEIKCYAKNHLRFFFLKAVSERAQQIKYLLSNPNEQNLILGYHVKVKVENPLYEDVLHTHAVVGMSPTQSNNT